MKARTILVFLGILCVALSLTLGCAGGVPAAKAPTEIVLGGVCSLTGMFAGFGEGSEWGLRAGIEDINKQGGVYVKEYDKKLPLKLISANSESDPVKTGTLAEDLILRNNVNLLVMGGEPPTTTAGVSNAADKYKVPFIGCCGPIEPWKMLKESATGHWEYTYACGTFAIATPAAAGDFRAKPGYTIVDVWINILNMIGDKTNKKVAVYASDDPDGIGWYGLFPDILKKAGYDPIGVDKKLGLAPVGTTDFSSTINEWKNNKCEIMWGNTPAPFFSTMWKQCATLGYKPKTASVGRAALFLEDVSSWGGDLPNGVGTEIYWHPSFQDSPGIGGTTPKSLDERWFKATGRGINSAVADGYRTIQVVSDAIERAGTLDREKIRVALKATDLMTVVHRVKFDANQFSTGPLVYGQWVKSDTPGKWDLKVVFSQHDFCKPTANLLFPIP